jgi:3D (Asp-Asp-Asp) domain-containing protein
MHSYEFKTTNEQQLFPIVASKATVTANASTAVMTAAAFSNNNTNTGASGTVVLTLPAASAVKNKTLRFYQTVAQITRLLPVTGEKIYLAGSGVATKYLNIAAVIGNFVDVYSDGVDFIVTGWSGAITKEA